jgi:glycosyltransferase involved in cell wall biosynthesis
VNINLDKLSIVLPAKNEANSLKCILPEIIKDYPASEIIIVDDGSTDDTENICTQLGVNLLKHPYTMGNGASIKTGARAATGDILLFMDADGQHDPKDISRLLEKMQEGYEMVVGARQTDTHASIFRAIANRFYNRLASFMTGYNIEDLTSGFRLVTARHFRKFLYLLPNGFSYPTTITMAFFRSGYPLAYIPIRAGRREGKSHISLMKDGVRFFIIILKVGALFSPMRLFLPICSSLFVTGIAYYTYTFLTMGRFTNMSALLFLSSLIIFLIGILSEHVSSLHYRDVEQYREYLKQYKQD